MDNNNYDFYTYGMRTAKDIYADSKKIAEKIEKNYGSDARLEFECGLSIELSKQSIIDVEKNTFNLKKEILGSNIIPAQNMRNNSYFGDTGVSKQYKDNGEYNDPKTK